MVGKNRMQFQVKLSKPDPTNMALSHSDQKNKKQSIMDCKQSKLSNFISRSLCLSGCLSVWLKPKNYKNVNETLMVIIVII